MNMSILYRLAAFFLFVFFPLSVSPCFAWEGFEGWQYRALLSMEDSSDTSSLPAEAAVTFTAAARDDGADIRIADETGNEAPLFLVHAGPGSRYQAVFPRDSGKRYFLYWGNPSCQSFSRAYSPRRGLYLDIHERKGGGESLVEARATVEQSARLRRIGRRLWGNVWDGTNPLGSEKDVVKRYDGNFYLASPMKIAFATSSSGPSFVLVDGEPVASWPGWHRAEPFVRPEHSGIADLREGVHSFSYCHLSSPGMEIAVAAYKMPGDALFRVIPPSFFPEPVSAKPVLAETRDGLPVPLIVWKNTHFLFREKWQFVTMNFSCDTGSAIKPEVSWDFGDGQKGAGKDVFHTWIRPGIYPVSCSLRQGGRTVTHVFMADVFQDYAQLSLPSRSGQEYIAEFSAFDSARMDARDLLSLAQVCVDYGALVKAAEYYTALRKRNPSAQVAAEADRGFALISMRLGRWAAAEPVFVAGARDGSVESAMRLGDFYLKSGNAGKAEEVFIGIGARNGISQADVRKAAAGLGDAYRLKGETGKALLNYRKAASGAVESPAQHGARAQEALSLLRNNDFAVALEKLGRWAEENPAVKMDGDWTILMTRALILGKEYDRALREAGAFMKISLKTDPYYPWALYFSAEANRMLGDTEQALILLRRLAGEFPESQAAAAVSTPVQRR